MKSHADYKSKLTPQQYNICFLKGTEPPFSGKYNKHYEPGTYVCVACGNMLFASDTKYDSGTGWPSFWDMAAPGAVKTETDRSMGMLRTEVLCSRCGAHLGHVFKDGPRKTSEGKPATGKRYCINSLALEFIPRKS